MVGGLLRALARRKAGPEDPVETLDVDTLRSRIGEPSVPERSGPPPAAGESYVRADGRAEPAERSWRRILGLRR